jgi:hypothetical protein
MSHCAQILPDLDMLFLGAAADPGPKARDGIGQRVITRPRTSLKADRSADDGAKPLDQPRAGERATFRMYRLGRVEGSWQWLTASKVDSRR